MKDTHPLVCHRPRIKDRIVFDKLIQVLVLGTFYARIADRLIVSTVSGPGRTGWILTIVATPEI